MFVVFGMSRHVCFCVALGTSIAVVAIAYEKEVGMWRRDLEAGNNWKTVYTALEHCAPERKADKKIVLRAVKKVLLEVDGGVMRDNRVGVERPPP